MVVGRLGSFLGRQKEKKGEMPVVEPPESLPRVQGVATAINGLSVLQDRYGALLSSPSRHVFLKILLDRRGGICGGKNGGCGNCNGRGSENS